jgi:hypothetical protein
MVIRWRLEWQAAEEREAIEQVTMGKTSSTA